MYYCYITFWGNEGPPLFPLFHLSIVKQWCLSPCFSFYLNVTFLNLKEIISKLLWMCHLNNTVPSFFFLSLSLVSFTIGAQRQASFQKVQLFIGREVIVLSISFQVNVKWWLSFPHLHLVYTLIWVAKSIDKDPPNICWVLFYLLFIEFQVMGHWLEPLQMSFVQALRNSMAMAFLSWNFSGRF